MAAGKYWNFGFSMVFQARSYRPGPLSCITSPLFGALEVQAAFRGRYFGFEGLSPVRESSSETPIVPDSLDSTPA